VPGAQDRATGRCKALGALVTHVVLFRCQVVPVGGDLRATGVDCNQILRDPVVSRLGQQLLDDSFRLVVVALAELVVADAPLRVCEIERWPVMVVERAPDRILIVDRDRIRDPHLLYRAADVLEVMLEGELWGVHTDHDQTRILVFLGPRAAVGEGAQPVDAGVGPKFDSDDLATQPLCRQG
jgi:hypothetical protein